LTSDSHSQLLRLRFDLSLKPVNTRQNGTLNAFGTTIKIGTDGDPGRDLHALSLASHPEKVLDARLSEFFGGQHLACGHENH
jgi:hypothetical protein